MKKTCPAAAAVCAAVLASSALAAQEANPDGGTNRVAAYYFGNSLTGCSDPAWHRELGASAGKDWECWAFLGAGWQLWQHLHALQNAGVEMKRDSNGDLTIDADQIPHSTGWNTKQFYGEKWDAIVLQPFGMGLTWKCTEMWGVTFDRETDVGDIASAEGIIDIYLALNPRGKVFIYQDWPAMEAGKIPPDDQLPEWAKRMQSDSGKLRNAEFPNRDAFDYAQAWAEAKYAPSTDPTRNWFQKNPRSKDYQDKVFAALKAHYPELWKSGRLRAIPVGDIFLTLDKKMRAGEFPGVTTIKDYYTDIQHIRGGLPRYTVAAAFFAALFDTPPDGLDWKLYNSMERYRAGQKGADDPFHDRGELLDITPGRANIVNETIWRVIREDPNARGSH